MRRRGPKPIGWALQEQHADTFAEEVQNIAARWTISWDLTDLTTEMQNLTRYRRPRQAAYVNARRSATEGLIKTQIFEAGNTNERHMLYKQLWRKRKQIATEKEEAQMTCVLQSSKSGGWGKTNLTPNMKGMTQFQVDDVSTAADATCRSAHETKYYTDLFQPKVDEADAAREHDLATMLKNMYEVAE